MYASTMNDVYIAWFELVSCEEGRSFYSRLVYQDLILDVCNIHFMIEEPLSFQFLMRVAFAGVLL
jgi:hypothetical protein